MEEGIPSGRPAVQPRTASDQTEAAGKSVKGHSRKKIDLTGQRYGKLTVLAPAENVG